MESNLIKKIAFISAAIVCMTVDYCLRIHQMDGRFEFRYDRFLYLAKTWADPKLQCNIKL